MPKEDAETRRTRLKNLIKLGKERGFLTYAEINDHLPDNMVDAEQIEGIISMFNDMGIAGLRAGARRRDAADGRRRADRRQRRGSRGSRPKPRCRRSTPSSAAPPTRCACTCARWARSSCSRAKARSRSPSASKTACKHMIQAISRLPDDDRRDPRPRRQDREGRDAHRRGRRRPRRPERRTTSIRRRPRRRRGRRGEIEDEEDEEDEEDAEAAQSAEPAASSRARRWRSSRASAACSTRCARRCEKEGLASDKDYLQARDQISNELMTIRFTAQDGREAVRHACAARSTTSAATSARSTTSCVDKGGMPRAALHQGLPGQRDSTCAGSTSEVAAEQAVQRGAGAHRAGDHRAAAEAASTCRRASASR